jgi:methanogenic corrinoid protein MtbC1
MAAPADATETEVADMHGFGLPAADEPESCTSFDTPPPPLRRGPPHAASLASLIAARVLPRLVLAHRAEASVIPTRGRRITPHDVLRLGEAVLLGDDAPAEGILEALIAEGVPLEAVYLDLLAPTARQLGELWCEDRLSFSEVTIGQVALQRLFRSFGATFLRDCPPPRPHRRVLLSPMPGEQHAFGHVMVCDFFRRAAWQVAGEPFDSAAAVVAAVRETRFEVVGLSLSCAERMRELGALIRALRAASLNAALGVLVGGSPFCGNPGLAWQVGADAAAGDAAEAPRRAEALVGMLAASA